jgi:gamma-glutamyltranspeptidase / glutathione hydrolase
LSKLQFASPRPLSALLLAALVAAAPISATAQMSEGQSGRHVNQPVFARHDMVAAADPLAAEAGLAILQAGGNAMDAALATAFVLNLVEPQSSGLGGGGFLVFYSAKEHRVVTFDGRETAPAAAKPDRFLKPDGTPLAFFDAVVGGRSVGVPGYLRMLELAHRKYGKLDWAALFAPAIKLATDGFPVSERLHMLLAQDPYLPKSPTAKGYFYDDAGHPLAAAAIVKNPALAATFKTIAAHGARAFYDGDIARDIAEAVEHASPPGDLTPSDLARYRAKERKPVCGDYRGDRICGMGPPNSGDITILEILGMLQRFPSRALDLPSPRAVHLFAEASKLAFADRERYLADTDFVPAPVAGLLDPRYLAARAKLIDPDRAAPVPVAPGKPAWPRRHARGDDASLELPSTSHLAIIDRDGNAVSMTNSIENQFGSRIMVDGFLLNNELTDFSFLPERDGRPVANRVAPGKRPRSAMSPTIAFDRRGRLMLAIGSSGGPTIIDDVAKCLIAVIDGKQDLQAALDLPDIGNRNGVTEIEAGPGAEALAKALVAMGHKVQIAPHPSGLHAAAVTAKGLEGAADPRRDGAVKGD